MHRTTLTLEGPVDRELRRLAAKERRGFSELVNELLKKGLGIYKGIGKRSQNLQWQTASASPREGFDPSNRSTYFDVISKNIA